MSDSSVAFNARRDSRLAMRMLSRSLRSSRVGGQRRNMKYSASDTSTSSAVCSCGMRPPGCASRSACSMLQSHCCSLSARIGRSMVPGCPPVFMRVSLSTAAAMLPTTPGYSCSAEELSTSSAS